MILMLLTYLHGPNFHPHMLLDRQARLQCLGEAIASNTVTDMEV
jgi:hypothetical protein